MTVAYGGHPGEHRRRSPRSRASAGLVLLEDAAHAVGVARRRAAPGHVRPAGAFSFFSNKNLAVGEGGMVVTDDDELAARMRLLRSHGMTTLTWDRHRGHASGYDVVALGFNYRIDEPRAALAPAPAGAPRRRERAAARELDARYRELLAGVDGVTPALRARGRRAAGPPPVHVVLDDGTSTATRFREALADARHPDERALPAGAPLLDLRAAARDLPVTDAYGGARGDASAVRHMTTVQQDEVVTAIRAALGIRPAPANRRVFPR